MWLAGIPVAGALSGTGVDVVVDANMPSNLGTGTDETEIIVGDFTPGRELGVYVLVAPEPDRQQPTRTTRSTSSSKGAACWRSKGRRWNSRRAQAAFVPAVAEHRFIGYEQLGVLVIFAQPVRKA